MILFIFFYFLYQYIRLNEIIKIYYTWVTTNDIRWTHYSISTMFFPTWNNYFNFKWPNTNDFK